MPPFRLATDKYFLIHRRPAAIALMLIWFEPIDKKPACAARQARKASKLIWTTRWVFCKLLD